MRTILIVDDERNIRLGLKAIIEREYGGAYETLCAADGSEALERMRARKTDILITDIRMPGMDGMELIRRAAAERHRPAVIILSGYDDFRYAKEAITHEVKEYLLKPIVREELHAALQRVESELARAEETAGRLSRAERDRAEMRAAALANLFLDDGLDNEEIAARCRRAGLVELEGGYAVGVLKLAGERRRLVPAEEALARLAPGERTVRLEDRGSQLTIVSAEEGLFASLMEELADKGVSPYYIGVSERSGDLGRMRELYLQAKRALKYSLLQPHVRSALIRYDDVRQRESRHMPAAPADEVRRLANMLGTGRREEMKRALLGLLDPSRLEAYGVAYIEQVGRQLNELVFDEVFRTYGEASVEVLKLYRRVGSIDHYASVQDYYHDVENLLLLLSDYIGSIKSAHAEHPEMRRAVQYIERHYAKELNMAVVSNYVSLNYSYFSQMFKEYTGDSFVHYLKKVRIARAKELLLATDDKIYEIAAKTGFESAKQFNRVFKELEGVTALEYRSRHSG